MLENENYHGSRIVNDKIFQKYVKKNTQNIEKVLSKQKQRDMMIPEIELIHFLIAEEECFSLLFGCKLIKKLK